MSRRTGRHADHHASHAEVIHSHLSEEAMPFKGALAEPSPAEAEASRNADTLFQMLTGHWVTQTIRAAAELRIADHLANESRTAEQVAEAEASDPATTYRLMRACASIGLLVHEGGRRFSLAPLGQLLREDVPGSMREAALVQGAPGHWQSWGLFPDAVRAGGPQTERALGSDIFEYFRRTPAEGALFSKAMTNVTGLLVLQDTVALLDLDGATRVVDIGGAEGALLLALMREHPEIEGQMFDLPHVVRDAQAAAERAGMSGRFSTVGGDFFEGVPEADYYLLKWILHDWNDEQCVKILGNMRLAARPGARVLVIEAVVDALGTPDPAALLDMNMLAVTSGQERDLDEFDVLFEASGWKRTAVAPTRSHYSLMELERME
ncbi:methyltransferase [Spirillospora sp. CA-255316]